ncbi:MAG: hypothetical protein IKE01_06555 [Clostridia bacterium]|nr:hypothetical protein [Clostridia bacterium]
MAKERRILTHEEKNKIEECKKELNKYKEDIKYIEEKLNDTEEIRGKVEKVTTTLSLTKTNSSNESPDKFADAISRLDELKVICSERLQELLLKKFEIDKKIESVGQPYTNVLFFRYTRGKSWEDVAKELGYTREYVCDLHGEALYLYSKI